MSVLIRGMEMPKTCGQCGFYHHNEDYEYYDYETCGAGNFIIGDRYHSDWETEKTYNVYEISNKQRHPNCPLVEVVRTSEGLYDTYTPPDEETAKHVTEVFRKSTERMEAGK